MGLTEVGRPTVKVSRGILGCGPRLNKKEK